MDFNRNILLNLEVVSVCHQSFVSYNNSKILNEINICLFHFENLWVSLYIVSHLYIVYIFRENISFYAPLSPKLGFVIISVICYL